MRFPLLISFHFQHTCGINHSQLSHFSVSISLVFNTVPDTQENLLEQRSHKTMHTKVHVSFLNTPLPRYTVGIVEMFWCPEDCLFHKPAFSQHPPPCLDLDAASCTSQVGIMHPCCVNWTDLYTVNGNRIRLQKWTWEPGILNCKLCRKFIFCVCYHAVWYLCYLPLRSFSATF